MSDPILISENYVLVIDTNNESYDFVQKLCAYCTGFYSEKETDLQYCDMFFEETNYDDKENPFRDFIGDQLSEEGVYSPCSVWLNKNHGSNEAGEYAKLTETNYDEYDYPAPFSMGIFFDQEPTEKHIKIIKERSVKFFKEVWKEKIEVEGFRVISYKKYAEEIVC